MRTRRRATRDRIAHSKFMRWAKLCGLHASWKRQGFRPVPPSPGPAGPRTELFGINADPAAPSWREYESKPLTREMYDRFYGIK